MNESVYKWIIVLLVIIIVALAFGKFEIKQINPVTERVVVQESDPEETREAIRKELRRHERLYGPIRPR